MDGISSTPVENSVQFLCLRDKYKSNLLDDSCLTKAAGLAAQKELLLESPAPDTWKEPRLKSVNRELRQRVKKIRQPGGGGVRGIGRDEEDSEEYEDERNLVVGSLQKFMGNIAKIQKTIKRKPSPVPPQTPVTPTVKQSPQTPSTSKKPKLSFTTGSKAKRLLPKTPKKKKSPPSAYKTPQQTAEKSSEELATELPFSDQVGKSPWKSPGELARDSLRAIRRRTRKSQSEEREKEGLKQTLFKKAQERALKKLVPSPGWEPFGTLTKRKLRGKDW